MTARRRKPRTLTDEEWDKVFLLRCQTKQGRVISAAEKALVEAAFKGDEKRYAALEPEVFNATVPFGSTAKWKKEET